MRKKNNVHFRNFCMLSVCLLLISALALPCFAAQDRSDLEWELSDGNAKLTYGFDVYEYYELPQGYYLAPMSIFEYADMVEGHSTVRSYRENGDMVWLIGSVWAGKTPLYANAIAKRSLDSLIAGNASKYFLEWNGYTAEATVELVESLDALPAGKSVPVSDLKTLKCLEFVGYESTCTVAFVHGAVYETDNGYCYIDYSALDNSYFDADGNFSYRRGEVSVAYLPEDLHGEIDQLRDDMTYRNVDYSYDDQLPTADGDDGAMIVFWVVLIIFGLLLPLIPLFLGVLLPRSEKRGYPKYWYALVATAALWMLCTLIFMVVLLLR